MQNYNDLGGFNSRRKRQIDLSGLRKKEPPEVTGIQWGNNKNTAIAEIDNIEYSWEEVEANEESPPVSGYNQRMNSFGPATAPTTNSSMSLNGKPIRLQNVERGKSFEEAHVRFTSYLEHDLYLVVQALKKQGHIRSITELVNESIKHYLTCTEI